MDTKNIYKSITNTEVIEWSTGVLGNDYSLAYLNEAIQNMSYFLATGKSVTKNKHLIKPN